MKTLVLDDLVFDKELSTRTPQMKYRGAHISTGSEGKQQAQQKILNDLDLLKTRLSGRSLILLGNPFNGDGDRHLNESARFGITPDRLHIAEINKETASFIQSWITDSANGVTLHRKCLVDALHDLNGVSFIDMDDVSVANYVHKDMLEVAASKQVTLVFLTLTRYGYTNFLIDFWLKNTNESVPPRNKEGGYHTTKMQDFFVKYMADLLQYEWTKYDYVSQRENTKGQAMTMYALKKKEDQMLTFTINGTEVTGSAENFRQLLGVTSAKSLTEKLLTESFQSAETIETPKEIFRRNGFLPNEHHMASGESFTNGTFRVWKRKERWYVGLVSKKYGCSLRTSSPEKACRILCEETDKWSQALMRESSCFHSRGY